jgi:hypothetical protein
MKWLSVSFINRGGCQDNNYSQSVVTYIPDPMLNSAGEKVSLSCGS